MTAKTKAEGKTVALTTAQEKHVLRLVGALKTAEAELAAAQEQLGIIQGQANAFIAYCSEENGAAGLVFNQAQMRFVEPTAQPDNKTNEEG